MVRAPRDQPSIFAGEVPEWSNGTVSKTVERASVPRVRIPPSPPKTERQLQKLTYRGPRDAGRSNHAIPPNSNLPEYATTIAASDRPTTRPTWTHG